MIVWISCSLRCPLAVSVTVLNLFVLRENFFLINFRLEWEWGEVERGYHSIVPIHCPFIYSIDPATLEFQLEKISK